MAFVVESFKNEAHLLPIFLKHLERVEVYEKSLRDREPRLTFSMALEESCLDEVRHKRQEFLLKARSAEAKIKSITTTFKLLIETRWYSHASNFSRHYHKYLVTFYYSDDKVSSTFSKLLKDDDINYLPWVGTAMPLDAPDHHAHHAHSNGGLKNGHAMNGNGDVVENGEDYFKLTPEDGRLFCFLPLPLEQGYTTGLPVLINGFFALEQNRKHMKWPESFSIRLREDMMDKQVLWNVCLLREVLPKCYTNLILEAIKISSCNVAPKSRNEEISFDITDQMIYRVFPNSEYVDKKWEEVLYPLYTELMKHQIVFTRANGGAWIEPKLAVFNKQSFSESLSDLLVNILLEDSVRVVTPPSFVAVAIRKYSRSSLLEVSPSLVSKVCRSLQASRSSIFKRLTVADKMDLLKYFVLQHKFDALDGLELLPLNDGTFHYFYYSPRKADRPIYILKDLEMLKLLPGVNKDLLYVDLEDELKGILMRAALKG